MAAVISFLVAPFGYETDQVSIFLASIIFMGLIGAIVFSIILDKTKKFQTIYSTLNIACLVLCSLFYVTLREDFYIQIAIHLALFGFFLIAVLPVGYSFAVDLTHPVSESMTTGFVMTFATIWGSFFSYISAYILDIELKDQEEILNG